MVSSSVDLYFSCLWIIMYYLRSDLFMTRGPNMVHHLFCMAYGWIIVLIFLNKWKKIERRIIFFDIKLCVILILGIQPHSRLYGFLYYSGQTRWRNGQETAWLEKPKTFTVCLYACLKYSVSSLYQSLDWLFQGFNHPFIRFSF